MIKLLYKGFSMLLALLVLFSTVSFTIEKHFCGDVLVDISIFTEADKCAMEAYEIALEKVTKKPCCKDVVDVIEGQNKLKFSSFEDLDFEKQQIIASYAYTYINLFEELPKLTIPHKNYSPPNLVTDIQVLDQVFLI
ncbi:hypothetical protein Q4Q39_13765 [Flavivirga amylovorans]|uniref:Uncharacterized protein n=1 Tax=Flavivirga amylovorans TaxID=870486 RepID=A0ABT8X3I6_9FLAO|nr:hypothetical protein [Flavivirga amylovorans]MDO5988475.1 hypothetical protein [Flavivirga amylovorans]